VQVFLGDAMFIEGTRPDVQASFPRYPRNRAGGWGFMLLTNTLPNQGNDVYSFWVYASDREGHVVQLGERTITCDNANAMVPFGTIDTPAQGETISGAAYVNFGWALTQPGTFIPFDGSSINVYVDGIARGAVSYNHYRVDIATLFPGLANSNGAVGFSIIDTTTLSNGLHTIVWTAIDASGHIAGLGSRFFRVSNPSSAFSSSSALNHGTGGPERAASDAVTTAATPIDSSAILARRGWSPGAPWHKYAADDEGRTVIRGEELDRFEILVQHREGERLTRYLCFGSELSSLPIGSHLDARTGEFVWSPGAGFVGAYDFVFLCWARDRIVARQELRVVIHPKGTRYRAEPR
jgi:hypothetical protein